jgi:hypothetical protein
MQLTDLESCAAALYDTIREEADAGESTLRREEEGEDV